MKWAKPTPLVDNQRIKLESFLPRWTDIPDEFKNHYNPWNTLVSELFFEGGKLPEPKKDIDPGAESNHIQIVLSSFEPKHEHKTAGAAYLMSLWYNQPKKKNK